jgi:cytochrome P450
MDGITLPAGSRAIAFYGASNRDERKFPNPNAFDVTRNSAEQLAFGSGPHVCVGMHLARLEMAAIFCALAARVNRFHIEEEVRSLNNCYALQQADRFRRIGLIGSESIGGVDRRRTVHRERSCQE